MFANENLFPGINPILNSHLQQPDSAWDMFHSRHIGDIVRKLETLLPEGYYPAEEKSLQIHIELQNRPHRTKPDVTIYRVSDPTPSSTLSAPATPTMTFPVTDTFTEIDDINAILIYRAESGNIPGTPITRIELLSPGNKPQGSHYQAYRHKRQETLLSGVNVVEIDYLHETRPILEQLPSYLDNEEGAYPYWIIVSGAFPSPAQGQVNVYGVDVISAIPPISIPLIESESIIFPLQKIYNQTVGSSRLLTMLIDYDTLPIHFERYHTVDQERIQAQLDQIRKLKL